MAPDIFIPPNPLSHEVSDTYGIELPEGMAATQVSYDLIAFRIKLDMLRDGSDLKGMLPAEYHLERLIQYFWPPGSPLPFYIIESVPRMVRAICNYRIVCVMGNASSGKTGLCSCISNIFFALDVMASKVIVVSTDLEGSKNRIWGQVVDRFDNSAIPIPAVTRAFKVVPLHPKTRKAHDRGAGMELIAGHQNYAKQAENKIVGYKQGRFLLVIDEGVAVAGEISESFISNLMANKRAQMIILANFADPFDAFGRMVEPKDGWDSVDVNTGEWLSKRGAYVIHIDGLKATNWLKKSDFYPFLQSWTHVQNFINDQQENSPNWWRMVRSFWPPVSTGGAGYYDFSTLLGSGALETVANTEWSGTPEEFFGLDQAYTSGGDECILSVGRWGTLRNGDSKLEVTEEIKIIIDVELAKTRPASYQICDKVRDIIKERGGKLSNLAFDSTNRPFTDIVQQELGVDVIPVHSAGAPTISRTGPLRYDAGDAKGSPPKPNNRRFGTRAAELWCVPADFIHAGVLCGIKPNAAQQACIRKLGEEGVKTGWHHKNTKDQLTNIETKRKLVKRVGFSPDKWDAISIMVWGWFTRIRKPAYQFQNKREIIKTRKIDSQMQQLIDALSEKQVTQIFSLVSEPGASRPQKSNNPQIKRPIGPTLRTMFPL